LLPIKGDVANLEDLDELYAEVEANKGKMDILFTNAGLRWSPPSRVTPESISKDLQHQCPWSLRYRSEGSSHLNDGASIVINGSGVWVEGFPAYGTGRKPVVLRPEAV
jgi:NAD(P)-dependent dehydrogenase (short-subunit alcohol dehydrogenase family)